MTTETFIPTELFERIAEAATRATPCAMNGKITANEIKIAIGEFANVWPESIRADVISDRMNHTVLK
jgi:hypothetical protein